jgi:hypothetical protein
MQLVAAPLAVSLPGELWLVAGALVWPLSAWVATAVRDVPDTAKPRVFARTAAVATGVGVFLLAAAAVMLATNGTTRAFQALAAQVAAGLSLLGAVLSGVIAIALRRTTRATHDAEHHKDQMTPERRHDEERRT